MYPFSVRYVCKLDSMVHILCTFGLALKLGVTGGADDSMVGVNAGS
jgi:hypothetical protein